MPNSKVQVLMEQYQLEAVAAMEIGNLDEVDEAFSKIARLRVPRSMDKMKDGVLQTVATMRDNAIPDELCYMC